MNVKAQLPTWIAKFVRACQAGGLASCTISWYRSNLHQFQEFVDQEGWITLTVDELRMYVIHLQSRDRYSKHPTRQPVAGGLVTYSVIAHVRTLKRFFGWLHAEGLIETNPAAGLKVPRKPERVPRGVALDDTARLLVACMDNGCVASARDRALIWFLAGTGCRVGEACNLRWADVDLVKGTATVRGKGDKERVVFLDPPAVDALRAWRKEQPVRQLPGRRPGYDSVFTGPRGPLTPSGVNHLLKRLAQEAGITGRMNPHAFRHAFGLAWVMNGGDLKSLADQLGHRSIEVTQIYTGLSEPDRRKKHRLHSPAAQLVEAVGKLVGDGQAPGKTGVPSV
jgi:site-specific recombinase XerD